MGIDTPKVNNDIPTPDAENIESSKLEWGPDFGYISRSVGINKIFKLNNNLPEGEKEWRLPTIKEIQEEIEKPNSTLAGFKKDNFWSSITVPNDSSLAYFGSGYFENGVASIDKDYENIRVRCVR